jgi:hypothetical protein
MSEISQDNFISTPEFVQFSVITSILQFGADVSITKVIPVHSDTQDNVSSVFVMIVYSQSGKGDEGVHHVPST